MPINHRARRSGHDHAGRLDALEGMLQREPERDATIWDLLAWSREKGGETSARASAIMDGYAPLANELVRIIVEARDAGEITSGNGFPSLLWSQMHLSPERQARYEAVTQGMENVHRELIALCQQEGKRQP